MTRGHRRGTRRSIEICWSSHPIVRLCRPALPDTPSEIDEVILIDGIFDTQNISYNNFTLRKYHTRYGHLSTSKLCLPLEIGVWHFLIQNLSIAIAEQHWGMLLIVATAIFALHLLFPWFNFVQRRFPSDAIWYTHQVQVPVQLPCLASKMAHPISRD